MFETVCSLILLLSVLISKKLHPDNSINDSKVLNGNPECLVQLKVKLTPSLHFVLTLQCTMSRKKGPVCREKLVLLYLCMLLLAESYAPEPNPGPRQPKFPCSVCEKAVKWTTPGFSVILVRSGTTKIVWGCLITYTLP